MPTAEIITGTPYTSIEERWTTGGVEYVKRTSVASESRRVVSEDAVGQVIEVTEVVEQYEGAAAWESPLQSVGGGGVTATWSNTYTIRITKGST